MLLRLRPGHDRAWPSTPSAKCQSLGGTRFIVSGFTPRAYRRLLWWNTLIASGLPPEHRRRKKYPLIGSSSFINPLGLIQHVSDRLGQFGFNDRLVGKGLDTDLFGFFFGHFLAVARA